MQIKLKSVGPIVFVILLTQCAACAWFEKSERQRIVGDYFVGWNDLESNRSITKQDLRCNGCSHTLVEGYVSAVGHNEKFIIAEQRSNTRSDDLSYFIIDIAGNQEDPGAGLYGPLTQNEFDTLCVRLDVNIRFDMVFE